MKFVCQWYLSDDLAGMETLGESNLDEFTCFIIKWSTYHDANGRTWSADTRFVGSNVLGKLMVALPHVQFHGTTAVSVYELIKELQLT